MEPGPSSLSSSVSGKSSTRTGLISSEMAPGFKRRIAGNGGDENFWGIAGRVDGKDSLILFYRPCFLGIVHDLGQIVVIDYGTVWQSVGWIRRLLRLQFIFAHVACEVP